MNTNLESRMMSQCRMLLLIFLVLTSTATLAQNAGHPAQRAVELGWSYVDKGDNETALKRFNQALVLDPKFAPAYFGIADVYSTTDRDDLAIVNYRKSIEADPTFSHSYSNLGLALIYTDRLPESLPMLKKALELDPTNGHAYENTALYYFKTGDFASSWKYVHLAQDNNFVVRTDLLQDLTKKMRETPRNKVAK